MKWFRQTLRNNRVFLLTVLAVNIFYMVEGVRFVEARQLRLQEEERHLEEFSAVFGIPMEKLRGDGESVFEPIKKLVVDGAGSAVEAGYGHLQRIARQRKEQAVSHLSQAQERVGELIRIAKRSLSSGPQVQIAAAFPQERPSPIQATVTERAPRARELSASSLRAPGGLPLPLRRVEKKVRTEEADATAGPGAKSTVRIPPPVPREVIPKDGIAPEIVALAESLGNSPAEIFSRVHDSIDFDPKWGVHRSPLGTLHEGKGTAWDQAWLLHQLLSAAGVDARFQWGEIEIPTAILLNLTGIEDPWQAGNLMTTAGVPIVLVVQGSQVLSARMFHVWLTAYIDFIPNRGMTPGPGDYWVRMDPTLKRFAIAEGVRLDDQVPFNLGEYLESGTPFAPRQVYEEALQAHITDNNLGISLEEVTPSKTVIQDAFPFVPGTLRGRILTFEGESPEVPEAFQQQLELEIRAAGGSVLATWSTPWSAVYGQRLEVAWPGATAADQATLDLYGGVFATPPYEVDLKPVIRVDGVEVAAGGAMGSAEEAVLLATITPPQGSPIVMQFEMLAGEHGVFTVDFGQMPQEVIDHFTQELSAATDPIEEEGWTLALAGALYQRLLSGDLEHLAGLRWQRLVQLGTAVLAVQRGAVSTAADGTPLIFSKGPMSLDLGAMPLGLFPASGAVGSTVPTLELLGSQGSFLEGEALSQVIGGEQITAVTFLTRAVREGQTLTLVDAGNVDAALAGAELSAEAEAHVRAGVAQGKIAWIAESQLPVDTWQTSGYILEDPDTGAAGYFVTFERLVEGMEANIVFHSPHDLDVVTEPIDVVATIESEALDSWTLSYQRTGEGPAVALAAGTGPVTNATLAEFDPTSLVNGLYDIVLTGRDIAGQSASGKISVIVDGGMKIGHFVLPLLDLSVPIVGVPFEIARIYDSKDRGPNDFGHGWRLQLSEYEVRENTSPGLGWRGTVSAGAIPTYCIEPEKPHLVVVRFPDGSLARYQPRIEPYCQPVSPQQVVSLSYVPAPGTRSEIEPIDVPGVNLLVVGSFPGPIELWELGTNLPHNPNTYRLTTATGAQLEIDEDAGLHRIIDTNGNVVEVSPGGLLHSRGLGISFERDSAGRITQITDPGGNVLTYEYDAGGDLLRTIDRVGRLWQYTYADDHFLNTIIAPDGREVAAFSYDGENRWSGYCEGERCIQYEHEFSDYRERVRDAAGNELVYEYDEKGNVVSMTDLRGQTTLFEYNEYGDLTRQVNPNGGVLEYEYDERRNLFKRIEPHPPGEPVEHFTTTYTHGPDGRVTRVDFPTGAAIEVSYDAQGNLLRQEDENGNALIELTYGPGGVVTSETGTFGTITYDDHNAHGDPRTVTDAFGVTTTYTYDDNGNVLTQSDPLISASFTYDGQGRDTSATYSNGVSVTSTYGVDDLPLVTESSTGERTERLLTAAGQIRGWKKHGGFQVDYAYNDEGILSTMSQPVGDLQLTYEGGRVATRTDFRGNTESFEYDPMGRVIRQTNGLGHSIERTIDVADRVRSITNPRGKTWTMSYEPNKSIVLDPLAREEVIEFDAHGLPIRLQRANGAIREITYLHSDPFADPEQYPTSITDIGGGTVTFGYNEHGNPTVFTNNADESYVMTWNDRLQRLTSVTGPEGNRRSFGYDDLGRLEEVTFGDGGTLKLTYDGRGLVETKTLPSGTRFDFTYDAGFHPTGWTTTAGESASLVWNSSDLLTSTTDATGTTRYTYDGPDLKTIENSDGSVVTYGYDILGRVTSITVTSAGHTQTTAYGYDEVGNLVSVTDPGGGATTMTYDAVNRLVSRTLPNGVTTTYEYNDLDQMIAIVHRNAEGTVLRSVTYERRGGGEPTKITREDGSYQTLAYDDALRLVSESYFDSAGALLETIEYTYDGAGNRRTRVTAAGTETYVYDPGNRLASVSGPGGVETYSHNSDGRLVGIDRDGTARTLEYSSLDQLTGVRNAAGADLASFAYDAVGRRVRTGDAVTTGRRVAVAPVSDPARFLTHLVVAGDGSPLAGYAFAHEKPLMRVTGSGPVYYLTDAKGSVIGMVDENAQVVADLAYDGFGNLRRSEGPASALDSQVGGGFRFHGEWLDEATSFYFLRARTYDPRTGRFLSRDGAELSEHEPASLNAYVFAHSNPHVYSDPLGLFTISEVNIVNAIENVLGSIDVQLKRYAVDEAKEAAVDAAIEFLRYVLESQIGPLSSVIEKAVSTVTSQTQQGEVFEWALGDILCRVLHKVPAFEVVSNYLFLEVQMDSKDGRAITNGMNQCNEDGRKNLDKIKYKKLRTNPDFLLSFNPPSQGSRSTILVGDFKRSASEIKDNKQFRTIVKHAKNYGFWTVLYITLFRGRGPKASSNRRRTEPVVQVFVLSLFGGKGRR